MGKVKTSTDKLWISENWHWLVGLLAIAIAAGAYINNVKNLKDDMIDVKSALNEQEKREDSIESQLSAIVVTQKNIKDDVSQIKSILIYNRYPANVPSFTNEYSDGLFAKTKTK